MQRLSLARRRPGSRCYERAAAAVPGQPGYAKPLARAYHVGPRAGDVAKTPRRRREAAGRRSSRSRRAR